MNRFAHHHNPRPFCLALPCISDHGLVVAATAASPSEAAMAIRVMVHRVWGFERTLVRSMGESPHMGSFVGKVGDLQTYSGGCLVMSHFLKQSPRPMWCAFWWCICS